jgi:hypothetical protein
MNLLTDAGEKFNTREKASEGLKNTDIYINLWDAISSIMNSSNLAKNKVYFIYVFFFILFNVGNISNPRERSYMILSIGGFN